MSVCVCVRASILLAWWESLWEISKFSALKPRTIRVELVIPGVEYWLHWVVPDIGDALPYASLPSVCITAGEGNILTEFLTINGSSMLSS